MRKAFLIIFAILIASVAKAQAPQQFLYLAEVQSIQGYSINAKTGALLSVSPPVSDSHGPVALSAAPNGLWLFVLNSDASISAFSINQASGVFTELSNSPFVSPDGVLPAAVVVSPDSLFLYAVYAGSVANLSMGIVEISSIAPSGSLAIVGSVAGPSLPIGAVFANGFLYVVGSVVQGYSVSEGNLTALMPFNLSNATVNAVVGTNSFLFVAGGQNYGEFVDSFSANADGSLTLASTYSAPYPAAAINNEALDSTGLFLYTNQGVFSISNGVLSLIMPAILPPGPATPLLGDQSAAFLFQGDPALSQNNPPLIFPFRINSDGTLVNSTPPLALAGVPTALAIATTATIPPALPAFVFEPNAVNFNPIQVGQSLTAQITLYSTGSAPLVIQSISITGDPSFTQTNNCPGSLPPSASCNIQATFAPQSPGTFTATLNLSANASGSVLLSGDPPAAPAPNFTLSATPTTVSVNPGSMATSQIVVTAINGFSGTVVYQCSDPAPMSSCAITPNGVLTMSTASGSNLLPVAAVLSIGALLLIPARKRKVVLATGALLLLGACGSSSRSLTVQPTAPVGGATSAGTYIVTVSGKSGTLSQTVSVTLVVE